MDSERDFETLKDMTPRQLWIALAAAYQALAQDEALIRNLSTIVVWADTLAEGEARVGVTAVETNTRIVKLEDEVECLRQMVGIDPLTKALNRYLIGDWLEEAVGFCRRMKLPLSVLFLDVRLLQACQQQRRNRRTPGGRRGTRATC